MASIPGTQFDITGASGLQGLLAPQGSWRAYVFPRGGYASQDSTGTLITFDTASVASRFAVNNWIQAGLSTANIRQVSAVGGNSISVSGAALTVSQNTRIFLIGNTQPTVSGGSATYTTPASTIRQRDDDTSTIFANSMVTSNSNGLVQFFSEVNVYDCLIQDGNQSNQGAIIDLPVGAVEGVSTSTVAVFGATVTMHANAGITGSLTVRGTLGITGWATFGATVTINAALGVTGTVGMSGTLNVRAARFKVNPVYDPLHPDYGAVGDGITNDTVAVQRAIDDAFNARGGDVIFTGRSYACNVVLRRNVSLVGWGGRGADASLGAALTNFNGRSATVALDPTADQMQMRNLVVSGSTQNHTITRLAGSQAQAHFNFENCVFLAGATYASVYFEGDLERITFEKVQMLNGGYGFWFANVLEGGGANAFARSRFSNVIINGQTFNALRLSAASGNAVVFENLATVSVQQEAIIIDGNPQNYTFIGWNEETTNFAVGNARKTTGTIVSGSSQLTIGNSTGYVVGDTVTVRGAGPNGTDLTLVLNTISGNTFGLSGNANTSVTSLQVTRSASDTIRFGKNFGAGGGGHVFIGCNSDNPLARYTINPGTSGAGPLTIIGCNLGRDNNSPIYDPSGNVMCLGGAVAHRMPSSIAGDSIRMSTLGAYIPSSIASEQQARIKLVSPSGGAITLAMRDTNDDNTGTYGEVELRMMDAARTRLLRVNSAGNFIRGTSTIPSGVFFAFGTGSPEGVLGASIGSIYQRTDGGAATSMYVKESGVTSSGWIAK